MPEFSIYKMSSSLLLIHNFIGDYYENLILITVFIVTYTTLSLLKKELPKQEKLTLQKMAEEYLKKHQTEDEQFFFSNCNEN